MSLNHRTIWLTCWLWLAALPGMTLAGESAPSQSLDSIRARVEAFLLEQLQPSQRQDAEIEIGRMDPRLRLRQCTAPLQAFAMGGRPTVGSTSVGVRCDDEKPWTLYVTAQVVVYDDVLVATRALRRGETLAQGDLRLARKDLSRLAYGYLTDAEAAQGQVLKRSYLAGQVVQPGHLDKPVLVKRGQQVTLHARSGGIEIHMGGEALSDGAAGERIQVRNNSSNRVVEGEVVAKGVVRVRI